MRVHDNNIIIVIIIVAYVVASYFYDFYFFFKNYVPHDSHAVSPWVPYKSANTPWYKPSSTRFIVVVKGVVREKKKCLGPRDRTGSVYKYNFKERSATPLKTTVAFS